MSQIFEGLKKGAAIVGLILLAVIGGYALAIMGEILVGIFVGIVQDGSVTVPTATNTSVSALGTAFSTLVTTVLNPYSTIAALVIIAVLLVIFFKDGKLGGGMGGVN